MGEKHAATAKVLSLLTLALGLLAAFCEFVLPGMVDSAASTFRMSLPFYLAWYAGPGLGLLSLVFLGTAQHYSKGAEVSKAYKAIQYLGAALALIAICYGAFIFVTMMFAWPI